MSNDYEDDSIEDDDFEDDDHDDIEGADEDLADGEDDPDDYAEAGELCPSCGEYLLDGTLSGETVECPICGSRIAVS